MDVLPSALSDAVDGAFDLAPPACTAASEFATAKAQVIVAKHADDGLACFHLRKLSRNRRYQRAIQLGNRPTHCDGILSVVAPPRWRLAHLREKPRLRPGTVLGVNSTSSTCDLRLANARPRPTGYLVLAFANLELAMDLRRGEKNVDARALARGFSAAARPRIPS